MLNNCTTLGSSFVVDLLAGSATGGTSILCTYPLDLAGTYKIWSPLNVFKPLEIIWTRLDGYFHACKMCIE